MVPPAVELVPPAVKGTAPSPTASVTLVPSRPRWSYGQPPNPLLTAHAEEAAMPGLMSRAHVAEILDVSERTVRRWGAAGLLDERHLTPQCVRVTAESVLRLAGEADGQHDREEAAAA